MNGLNGHEQHLCYESFWSLDLSLLVTKTNVCFVCQTRRAIRLCKHVPKGLVSLAMVHRCCIRWQFRQRHLQLPPTQTAFNGRKSEHNVRVLKVVCDFVPCRRIDEVETKKGN